MSHSTWLSPYTYATDVDIDACSRRHHGVELVSRDHLLGATGQTPRDYQVSVPCLSRQLNPICCSLSVLRILRIPVRCGVGAIPRSNEGGTLGFSFDLCQLPCCPWRAPPFRFASSLHRGATQVAAPLTKYRAASYDLAAPAERTPWLASVGIGIGLLRSSISPCRAVCYPRGPN